MCFNNSYVLPPGRGEGSEGGWEEGGVGGWDGCENWNESNDKSTAYRCQRSAAVAFRKF